ncbi:MAG: methylthioribulose 1-phosphate dehydratase [Gammaproteobacteria bacterium]|nr:methylthioribulose 1-phosphate dehydratase [Gammaproteobacteria bacterium]
MASTLDDLTPRAALIEIARDFHARGWMAGTAGNLSAREDDGGFWITASGKPKGRLEENDFLLVSIADGKVIEHSGNVKPSAETAIHRSLYQCFPEARVCLHVHSVDACLAAARSPANADSLPLPPLEMLKGLGVWDEHPQVSLPLFENFLDVGRIADAITARFQQSSPQLPALMVRGHGITVWGGNLQEAYNKVEVMEFIMSYLARG